MAGIEPRRSLPEQAQEDSGPQRIPACDTLGFGTQRGLNNSVLVLFLKSLAVNKKLNLFDFSFFKTYSVLPYLFQSVII